MDSASASGDHFNEFEHNLRSLLFELNGKRVQVAEYQREVNGLLLRNHDLERQLVMERRSRQGVQLQLDLTMKASCRGDTDRENLIQKASRNELQLTLAQQEITILRAECQSLELKLMQLNQEMSQQSEQMHQLTLFKESTIGLQTRVKAALNTVSKETELLKSDLQRLSSSQQAMGKHSKDFEIALQHFTCLEKRQSKEREQTSTQIAALKAKVNELSEEKQRENETININVDIRSELIGEYERSMNLMEERLSAERETTRKYAMALSEAVTSQQSLQEIEATLRERIAKLETQLNTCSISEKQLETELEETRFKLSQSLNATAAKKQQNCVETQTSPPQSPTLPVSVSNTNQVEHTVTHCEELETSEIATFEMNDNNGVNDLTC